MNAPLGTRGSLPNSLSPELAEDEAVIDDHAVAEIGLAVQYCSLSEITRGATND
jgi:hypothetical protein